MEPLVPPRNPTNNIRFRRAEDNIEYPALDISLEPTLATAMNWNTYFLLTKDEQKNMLNRIFHDEVKSVNARKILSQVR